MGGKVRGVLISEVARVVATWDGKRCLLLERCPQFRGVLIEGFHCTILCLGVSVDAE